MKDKNEKGFPWQIFLAEFFGTGLLLLIGISIVTMMFGTGSPIVQGIPEIGPRRLATGFLFGSTGALIALSRLGKVSGAHINPIVTMAFFLAKKIDLKTSIAYVLGQFAGAVIGCLPLLAWGAMGRSVSFGATTPGEGYTLGAALLGEIVTTFIMVSLLFLFLGFRNLRPYTPAIFPIIYSIMSLYASAISGLSTNPARSFGPSVISGVWNGWWIYWIGPVTGAFLATLVLSRLAKRITTAKLYHFDSDSDLLFRKKGSQNPDSTPIGDLLVKQD